MTLKHQIKEETKSLIEIRRAKGKLSWERRRLKGEALVTCNNHKFLCELIFDLMKRIMKIIKYEIASCGRDLLL